MNAATVPQIALPSAPVAYETQVVNMLERVVRDLTVDPARVKEFMELHKDAANRLAVTVFNDALAAAQSEIERVAPDSHNTHTKSRYASYAAMDAAIRPTYSKHGFALSYGTEDSPSPGCIRIVCDVSKGAHVKRYHIDMPADGRGASGNNMQTRTHATGSAVTYGRRYLLAMIFNVAVGEMDDDGNGASKRITARARNAAIAELPEDERREATERAIDEWSDRQAGSMRNGLRQDDVMIWGDAETTTKTQFLLETRERIRTETDGRALADWWNSEEQKQARHDFELSRNEFSSLRDFIKLRLDALKGA